MIQDEDNIKGIDVLKEEELRDTSDKSDWPVVEQYLNEQDGEGNIEFGAKEVSTQNALLSRQQSNIMSDISAI